MKDLYLLTLMHLLVDGVCGAVLAVYALQEPDLAPIMFYFGLYTVFAFGLQGPTGWLLDRYPDYIRKSLTLSTILLAIGAIPQFPIDVQVVFLGLGNCLFHVVGGSYVLSRFATYTEIGLFVSSGAIGLGLGLYSIVNWWIFLGLACLLTIITVINMIEITHLEYSLPEDITDGNSDLNFSGIAVLLFSCIVLRGFGSSNSIDSSHVMLLPCTFAFGKFLGGLVCDKIGYRKIVLLVLFIGFIGLKIQGMYGALLFVLACNMTMPLTLRLAHWCRISAPGLMFGLAASCLVPGTVFKDLISFPPQLILVLQFLILFIAGYTLFKKEYENV